MGAHRVASARRLQESGLAGPRGTDDAVRARRDAVLAAALSVFETKGLEEASIRLIAKAAGLTTGAIYPYFSGKEEIYAELLAQSLDTTHAVLLRSVEQEDTREGRFRAVLLSFFDHYVSRPSDLSLALYLFRGFKPQGLTPELNTRLNRKALVVLDVIKQAAASLGDLDEREAELERALQVSFLWGLLTVHHTKRSRLLRVDPRALLEHHVAHAIGRLSRDAAASGAPAPSR